MPSRSPKPYCALCRGDHSDPVVRDLCGVGFYCTAMQYRDGNADVSEVIARLRRSCCLNGTACERLAAELEDEHGRLRDDGGEQ